MCGYLQNCLIQNKTWDDPMLYIRSFTLRILNNVVFVLHSKYKYLFSSNFVLFTLQLPWGEQRRLWHGCDPWAVSSAVEETMYNTFMPRTNVPSCNHPGVIYLSACTWELYVLTGGGGGVGKKHWYVNAWEKEKNKEMKISLLPDYL